MADEKLTVPLAHKIPAKDARWLGADEVRDYLPGEDITVPRRAAEMLFGAAQLQGHPRSAEDRERLLGTGARIVPETAEEAAAKPAEVAEPAVAPARRTAAASPPPPPPAA